MTFGMAHTETVIFHGDLWEKALAAYVIPYICPHPSTIFLVSPLPPFLSEQGKSHGVTSEKEVGGRRQTTCGYRRTPPQACLSLYWQWAWDMGVRRDDVTICETWHGLAACAVAGSCKRPPSLSLSTLMQNETYNTL